MSVRELKEKLDYSSVISYLLGRIAQIRGNIHPGLEAETFKEFIWRYFSLVETLFLIIIDEWRPEIDFDELRREIADDLAGFVRKVPVEPRELGGIHRFSLLLTPMYREEVAPLSERIKPVRKIDAVLNAIIRSLEQAGILLRERTIATNIDIGGDEDGFDSF